MTHTAEERLIEAMRLIEETRDYLSRLPSVPITYAHIRRMTAFLDDPASRLLMREQVPRRGAYWLPTGVPLLSAELRGDTLRLWQPLAQSGYRLPPVPLSDGITFDLHLDDAGETGGGVASGVAP